MKIRNRYLLRVAGWLATRLVKLLFLTVRCRSYNLRQNLYPVNRKSNERTIYVLWHENLLLPPIVFGSPDIAVLISKHADGQLLDSLIHAMGMSSVRGSTNRGGVEALKQLLDTNAPWKHLGVTPDGPRGPRRVVQPGIIFVAAKTGMTIVPVGVGYCKPFRTKSWDRFAIPKPFSRAVVVTGAEIRVPATVNPEAFEPWRLMVQNELDRLNAIAEAAAESGVVPPADQPMPQRQAS